MSDLDDLLKKQAEMAKYAMSMANEKDPERIMEMTAILQERGKELERMAKAIEAFYAPKGPAGPETRVILTPAQKERITEQTGVGLDTVILRDTPEMRWSKKMATVEPREIEREAAKQAAQARLVIETRNQVEKIIKLLEEQNVPELAETIAELKRDPTLGRGRKDS
ncbi:MAG TPA: hypothetical protein VH083_13180 [Myxococcales bacterium]|jgi:hypothetical protein|nr:hypothetical protein [Myxococcales bacterium]